MKKIQRKRLEILAEWLEKGGETPHIKFDMSTFLRLYGEPGIPLYFGTNTNACSSACCMAGALVQTFGDQETLRKSPYFGLNWLSTAKSLSGLTWCQAEALFIPDIFPLKVITASQAAKVVRHLLATGNVDWRVAGFANKN